ncbi:MAG: hypothetical protein HYU66_18335 [Armatimonadetes bacterium]|nr:hypothetical protein [Armatimonadota bacterium]
MASVNVAELALPAPTRLALERFTAAVAEALGDGLEAVVLYGSALTGAWQAGRSDLNVLLVLDRVDTERLQAVARAASAVKRAPLSPVVVARSDLKAAARTSPAVLYDLQERHALLHGASPLDGLSLNLPDLAAQVHTGLRDLLLRLRTAYLRCGHRLRATETLLVDSFGGFLHLLRGLLRVVQRELPAEPVGLIGEAARSFGLELRPLQNLYALRFGGERLRAEHAAALFDAYLRAVETAAGIAAGLAAPPKPRPRKRAESAAASLDEVAAKLPPPPNAPEAPPGQTVPDAAVAPEPAGEGGAEP